MDDGIARILTLLRNYGVDMRGYIENYSFRDYRLFESKTEEVIDKFDTAFVRLQNALPYQTKRSKEFKTQVKDECRERANTRRTRLTDRYVKEVERARDRFVAVNNATKDRETKFRADIKLLKDVFDQRVATIREAHAGELRKTEVIIGKRMQSVNAQLDNVRNSNESQGQEQEERIITGFMEQVTQRKLKTDELKKSIADVGVDRDRKLREFDASIVTSNIRKDGELTQTNVEHEKLMDRIMNEQRLLKSDMNTQEERISTTKRRALLSMNNTKGHALFANSALASSHTLLMKKLTAQINDLRTKITFVESQVQNVKEISLDAYADKFKLQERLIEDEVDARDGAVMRSADSLKKDYQEMLTGMRKRLKDLGDEVSDAQLRAIQETGRQARALDDKVSAVVMKNKQEIDDLNNDIAKVTGYLSKIQGEWESLRESTDKIYGHKLLEMEHIMSQRVIAQNEEMLRVGRENSPLADSTDYTVLLNTELASVEGDYKTVEVSYEAEKTRVVNVQLDEDRTRGILSTRRQFAEEVAILRENEEDIKGKLLKISDELLRIETEQRAEIEVLVSKLESRHRVRIKGYETKIEEQRFALKDILVKLEKKISMKEAACEEAERILGGLTVEREQERSIDSDVRETSLKVEFDEKMQSILKDIAQLKPEVEVLEQRNTELAETITDAIRRAELAKQKLNALRENFVKNIERSKAEIEYKYQRMIDEQQKVMKKLESSWQSEEQDYYDTIRHRTEELEMLERNHSKQIESANTETAIAEENVCRGRRSECTKIQAELAAKLKLESDGLKKEIAEEEQEFLKQQRWTAQDDRMKLKTEGEQNEKQLVAIRTECDSIKAEMARLQRMIVGRLKWECSECDALEREKKEVKRQILETVQKMHDTEKEDTNRTFAVSHFGKSNRRLPRLKTVEKADVY